MIPVLGAHDTISDYLQSERLTARSVWDLVETLIDDSPEAFLIADDSVQDKRYSRFIELVKLKEVPFKVRLFKLVAPNGDIDWVITNNPDETVTAQVVQDANELRWQVEELHRGLKQLTGSEKCQCRQARSQRNHLACCYHAWLSLKVKANQLNKTLYQVKTDLLGDYLRAELRNPRVPAFLPA
jgi:hypothetical protein